MTQQNLTQQCFAIDRKLDGHAQVADRATRDSSGAERPAFVGSPDGITFVRSGVIALDGRSGDVVWTKWSDHEVFSLVCQADLNGDGLPDAYITRMDEEEDVDDVVDVALELST